MNQSEIDITKNEDILSGLYEFRENEGNVITLEFKKSIKDTQEMRKNNYLKLEGKLKKYFVNEQEFKEIMELIKEYENSYNIENSLYYEQYYKTGIKDGVKFMSQCIK